MNRIDTTKVVDPATQQPWTTKSLNFLQNSVLETMSDVVSATFSGTAGSTSPIVLHGLAPGNNHGAPYLSDGLITIGNYFGSGNSREPFYCYGDSYGHYTGTPLIVPINTFDSVADPIRFSDGINKNIHQIRRWKMVDSGTYAGMDPGIPLSAFKFANVAENYLEAETGDWSGMLTYSKVNGIVYLNGSLTLSSNVFSSPTIQLPESCRPIGTGGNFFNLTYVGSSSSITANPYTAVLSINGSGIFTAASGGLKLVTNFNTFYFGGISYPA